MSYDDDSYDDFEWSEDHEDIEFMQSLLNDLAECYKTIANLPKERPIFSDKQVLSPEDLEIGKKYKHYHNTECCEQIVISKPYKHNEESDSWFFMVHSVAYDFDYEQSMADCSIIPYSNDGWNDTNYVEIV